MDLSFFLRGLVLGFSIAAPVGPIGLLCIRRTLARGRWIGLASGLGAASADAVYGAVAAFGLTAVTKFLTGFETPLRVGGGIFLVILGAKIFFTPPEQAEDDNSRGGHFGAWGSTFLLTLSNPATILSFAAVFAGLGLFGNSQPDQAVWLVAGVFSGSAAWWLLLSSLVSIFRERLSARTLKLVNRAAGLIIAIMGLAAIASAVFPGVG